MPFYETGSVQKNPLGEEDILRIANLIEEIQPHQIYAAGDLADLAEGTIKPLPRYKLIIFRDNEGIYAISSECTHLGCTLSFNKDGQKFQCPCHGSSFSKDGAVQRGPADEGLPWFSVEVDAQGKIKVDKSKTVPVGTKYKVETNV